MPCILFQSTAVATISDPTLGTSLSRSPTVLDLPFLTPPKHVRFPCPFQSPDLFASTHQTYSQHEYDRTPIEPPSEEERSCSLPGRGERCFDTDGDGSERAEDALAHDDDGEENVQEDDEIFGPNDADDQEPQRSTGTGMFRCYSRRTVDDDDDEEEAEEDEDDGEVEEEGETSDDQHSASSLRRSPTMSSPKRRPPTPNPTRRPSSSCSPTTSRRLQWMQTQSESLPAALRDRLLLLASSTDSPATSPTLEAPASPMMSVPSPPNSFSLFTFATTATPGSDSEVDDDAEERTLHSSTPRPISSIPVSYLAERQRNFSSSSSSADDSPPYVPSEPRTSYFPTTPPPRSARHPIEREDSECSSSNTTDEHDGYFHSPTCSSASSASDWGMEDILGTADTSLVESDEGGVTVERWEGLGKDLGLMSAGHVGGFRVSRWAAVERE